jgi:DNA-binding CsgD family transcriptional regulator
MSAQQHALTGPGHVALNAERYFDHRAAVGRTPEMLVAGDLEVIWLNAAALALTARTGPVGLTGGRMVLPHRGQEEALRAFLDGLGDESGVWVLRGPEGRWLIRAEPIAPVDSPTAWLLTWRSMDDGPRPLWADIGAALGLTRSEARLLHLLLDGQTVDEAAIDLAISVQTARTHIRRIYAKLGVSNREQLFATALPYRWS